jgi:hypothetical protein
MANLRQIINKNKVAREINQSWLGRYFEESDLGIGAEMALQTLKPEWDNSSTLEKVIKIPYFAYAGLVTTFFGASLMSLSAILNGRDQRYWEVREREVKKYRLAHS